MKLCASRLAFLSIFFLGAINARENTFSIARESTTCGIIRCNSDEGNANDSKDEPTKEDNSTREQESREARRDAWERSERFFGDISGT